MLHAAEAGKRLLVPENCGGSFLSMEDLIQAVELILRNAGSAGQVLNLASHYVTWEEIARMAVEVTGSSATVKVIPTAEWAGAAFLADRWELDDRRVREKLGFKPSRDAVGVRDALRQAIARTWQRTRG